MAKYVLLTGFEAFGGARINPSEAIVRSLEGSVIAGLVVRTCVLPVEADRAVRHLHEAVAGCRPSLTVSLGQAMGRAAIALERVARNVLDFDIPDNAGAILRGLPVLAGGPPTRTSTLPLESILEQWSRHGIPGYVSESAGTYVCNQVFYALQTLAAESNPAMPSGFVHLPALPEQAVAAGAERTPSMSFDLMKRAIEILVEAAVPAMERDRAMPA